jgi:hypothetical protein
VVDVFNKSLDITKPDFLCIAIPLQHVTVTQLSVSNIEAQTDHTIPTLGTIDHSNIAPFSPSNCDNSNCVNSIINFSNSLDLKQNTVHNVDKRSENYDIDIQHTVNMWNSSKEQSFDDACITVTVVSVLQILLSGSINTYAI